MQKDSHNKDKWYKKPDKTVEQPDTLWYLSTRSVSSISLQGLSFEEFNKFTTRLSGQISPKPFTQVIYVQRNE